MLVRTRRPGGVTFVAVLAWISGSLQILVGFLALTLLPTTAIGGVPSAWVTLGLGVLTVVVSLGVFRGNAIARLVVTIVFVLNMVGAIFTAMSSPAQFWPSAVSVLIGVIGLILLHTRAANEFFRF